MVFRITKKGVKCLTFYVALRDYATKAFNVNSEDLKLIPSVLKPAPWDDEQLIPMWYKRHVWLYAVEKAKIKQDHPVTLYF